MNGPAPELNHAGIKKVAPTVEPFLIPQKLKPLRYKGSGQPGNARIQVTDPCQHAWQVNQFAG